MTTRYYTARVAELLTEHRFHYTDTDGVDWCRCGMDECNGHANHQAEVLAAAGLIPTSVEWGVSWRGVPQQSLGGPLTEDEARSRAIHDFALIARPAHDWKDATDD
ncbi:hypothetical protein H9623_13115 [Oerskovia sp. Sa1BUA8]|uniref:Uncharacterized protein n=1 Tax=Oerskovia douganii TaxID=2762210 RepID=A0A9D5UBY5_9CELL|nr:hypothetical protein [Oerskovia douganii]MBE7701236.1 hypothetical protein [Oerskovia douganii]